MNLDSKDQLEKNIEIFIPKDKEITCFYRNSIMALFNSLINEDFGREIHENIEEYSKFIEKILITKAELEYLEICNIYEKKEYLEELIKDNNI